MNNLRYLRLTGVVGALTVLSGCAANSSQTSAAATEADRIAEQQRMISTQEAQIERLQSDLSRANRSAASATQTSSSSGMNTDLFPPNPKAGECYARVLIPAKYSTSTERVLIKEASERVEIVPASYKTVN
ncbi:MAG: hypothetical protein KJP03_07215, partial [Gammaproteobacteria bacterium]|nr:hypothetical protein [Gammaproteobacteria bacterium]